MKNFEHESAASFDEAVSLLKDSRKGRKVAIAGGSDLLGVLKEQILEFYNTRVEQAAEGLAIVPCMFSSVIDAESDYRDTLGSLYTQYRDELTMCAPEEFDALYDQRAQEYLDAGYQEIIDELTDYSYEALAEGYFGVRTESSYMEMQLNTLKELLAKENLTMTDKQTIKLLSDDFEKIPESISPSIVGNYLQLKNQYAPLLKELLQ